MGGEAVAVDVAGEALVLGGVLPDAHGGAHPQPFLLVADDGADEFVVQVLGVWEGGERLFSTVQEVKPFLRAHHDVAVGILAKGVYLVALKPVVMP